MAECLETTSACSAVKLESFFPTDLALSKLTRLSGELPALGFELPGTLARLAGEPCGGISYSVDLSILVVY
jgi:hypothetical protein